MKHRRLIFLAFLTVIVTSVYWKTFNYDLIWDDELYFKNNLIFIENKPLSAALKFSYFSEQLGIQDQDHYYRPVLTASFWLENKLWGIRNVTLRLTNLVIYILSLIFLFFFLKRQSEKDYFAEIATLIFALYPLNIDNIVWIVGRGDLLVLLWGVLTFLFLDLFIKRKKGVFLVCSSLFFFLGIFSKETFLLFLPLLILYERIKHKKVTLPYHLVNVFLTISFFILKNILLNIGNFKISQVASGLGSLLAMLGTSGYYFRTIVFPVYYDMFLPVTRMTNLFYLLFGLLFILFILYLFFRSKKDSEFIIPSAFFLVFLAGHVPLIFANIIPFQIYSRYMMIAALGFVWLLAKHLTRLKEQSRLYVVFAILILFIPSIVLNASSYKTKISFWQRAQKSLPNDAFVLISTAKTYNESSDYLSAELSLNRVLSLQIKREAAIMVSLLYADIERAKADYKSALRWLTSIEDFEKDPGVKVAPFIRYEINSRRAKVYMAKGDISSAEKLLEQNISNYGAVRDSYSQLYTLYVGYGLWEKAAGLEKTMKKVFPNYFAPIDTEKAREEFKTFSFDERMAFYIQSKNFSDAIALVKTKPSLDLDHQFVLAMLYYSKGDAEEGEKVIGQIISANANSYEIMNKIGYLYLLNFARVREALNYFEKSLALNSAQPEIMSLSARLKNDYLAKLTEVWKDKPLQ
jgi:tetratricopeptide (TPR) repeat protein